MARREFVVMGHSDMDSIIYRTIEQFALHENFKVCDCSGFYQHYGGRLNAGWSRKEKLYSEQRRYVIKAWLTSPPDIDAGLHFLDNDGYPILGKFLILCPMDTVSDFLSGLSGTGYPVSELKIENIPEKYRYSPF